MIAAISGDVVHNLRSALDHLAWQPYAEAEHGHDPRTDALGGGVRDGEPSPSYGFNPNALSSGDSVATFFFDGASPPAHFEPNLTLAVTIAEPDASWGQGLDIVEVLDGLRRTVAREININVAPLVSDAHQLPWD